MDEWFDSLPVDLLEELGKMDKGTVDLLRGLNPSQLRAAITLEGPVQINAVAGSGKTRVLTHRIAYMLKQGIKPNNIMCTTFTKKATEEMTSRLQPLIPKMALNMLTIGTSHSIGYRILSKEYKNMNHHLAPAFSKNLLINLDLKKFSQEVIKQINFDRTVSFEVKQELKDIPLPSLLKVVSSSKNEGMSASDFEMNNSENMDAKTIAYCEFFRKYEQMKWMERRVDADDLLYLLIKMFKEETEILEKYRRFYKYILVDEAQDNNQLQYELVRLVGYPQNNIFLVGDDDQCQPVGQKVLTDKGYKNIEDLDPEVDKVASYDKSKSYVNGIRKGHDFKIASREYQGELFVVTADHKSVKCTPNHKWIVKWDKDTVQDLYCVYLMRQRNKFRVGWCKMFNADDNFHLGIRCRNQDADGAWVLKVTENRTEASMWEEVFSVRFGLPQVPFKEVLNSAHYQQETLDSIFSEIMADTNLYDRACECLSSVGRDIKFPLWNPEKAYQRRGGTSIIEVESCNLIERYMMVPSHLGGKEVIWKNISLDKEQYSGKVYSLDVPKYELYITEGLVTHNSMYSFRGAKPREFIDFKSTYKGVTQIALEDNYRSNPGILQVANDLIKNNTVRLLKSLKAHKKDNSDCVNYSVYKDENTEADKTAMEIDTLVNADGIRPKSIAILYRTNAQSRALEDQLIMRGLPYIIHGGISFYERKEVKDLVAYMQLAINPDDNKAFERVINVPSRYLGKAFMAKVKSYKGSHYEAISSNRLSLKGYEERGCSDFIRLVEVLRAMVEEGQEPIEILEYLMENCYREYLQSEGDEEDEGNSRLENIETLKYVISRYEKVEGFLSYIQTMTSQAKHSIDGVQLMTIHKSKGLEFPVTFVVGASEGILPHFKSIETEQANPEKLSIEEERRLMYVAITRAESLCYISSIGNFNGRGTKPSRFIGDMNLHPKEGKVEEEVTE